MILLIAEYCPPEKRHIISVFKLIQDLLAPSPVKNRSLFPLLMDKLPPTHKAKWIAGAALNSADQARASVLSTTMSRLNAFLDSEMEQILCFESTLDTETFCREKSAIFIVLPEEDNTKYFMVSLFLQQLYREMLTIAEMAGALPVITTATDIRGKWAIDVFARKNHLYIEDMQKAKQISAKILEGKTVVAAIESGRDSIEGTVPEEVKIVPETYENPDIYIGIYERKLSSHVLRLIPQRITVGIGCRRGTSAEQIEQLVDKILKESHINKKSIGRIASIDLKKDEEGLLIFCNKYNIEPEFYPAEELKKVEGEFSVSTFVKKVTGVDNVCERSAVYTGGTLRIRKQAENGVTAAFAWDNWRVKFE